MGALGVAGRCDPHDQPRLGSLGSGVILGCVQVAQVDEFFELVELVVAGESDRGPALCNPVPDLAHLGGGFAYACEQCSERGVSSTGSTRSPFGPIRYGDTSSDYLTMPLRSRSPPRSPYPVATPFEQEKHPNA